MILNEQENPTTNVIEEEMTPRGINMILEQLHLA